MASTQAVLALDIGSSSLRACVFDLQGREIGTCAQRHHHLAVQAPGEATLAPDALLRELFDAVDAALSGLPANEVEIVGVGISAFWHTLIGLDAAGRPTTALITWADRRSAPEALALRQQWDERTLHRETGCRLHSSYWPARMRWLARTQPELCARSGRWVSAPDLVLYELFGVLRSSISMASGTGLLDIHRLRWSEAALQAAGLDVARLAAIDDEPLSGLRPAYAARWPRLARVPWWPAIGDGGCSNLGVGCADRGAAVLMLGTSGSLRVLWEAERAEITDDGLFCLRVDGRRWAGGMALSEGGAVAAWTRGLLAAGDGQALEREAAMLAADSHGLTVLPFLLGTRSPDWAEGRSGAIAGLTAASGPAQVYRAVLESVGLRFALLHRRLQQAWPEERRIVMTGAALVRSPLWAQIVTDCLGRETAVSGTDEGSLRGAAIDAIARHGAPVDAIEHPVRAVYRPQAQAHAAYLAAGERQARLDAALRDALTSVT